MINTVLSVAVIFCLLYGRLSPAALALLCGAAGAFMLLLGRHGHSHTHFLVMDTLAQTSRLNEVNPALKFWTVLALMALCVSGTSPAAGIFLTAAMPALIVLAGGLRLHAYMRLLALPLSFLMVSAFALLFEVSARRGGVLGIPVFGLWLCVGAEAQTRTALVITRALGALSCLYLLSLTTPMAEIIGVLRRARCPATVIQLMYLIYRYIFILFSMYNTMWDAARSRMGDLDYRISLRTAGNLYANLLSRSYRQANRNFDAMESRCFDTEIRFLESEKKISAGHSAAALAFTAFTLSLTILFR